jgi:DNA-nicking Smr family endonuclease
MTRRHLSDEDRALWAGIARSIEPLRKSKPKAAPAAKPAAVPPAKSVKKSVGAATPVVFGTVAMAPAKPPPLAPLERKLKKRVARGREPIDARIDLHGMTQNEAHAKLIRFLRRAQADGVRMALVVTGKGSATRTAEPGSERGVLKRQVPLWLALPEFRPLVVGFEDAHIGHGGSGALYVRLRREK